MKKMYKCTKDLQGASRYVGELHTKEEWKDLAIEWAKSDGNDDIVRELKSLKSDKIIPYIEEIWELRIEEKVLRTKEEIKKWLLKNCIDKYGNLDLRNLDFSDFEGPVYMDGMKVKNSLFQDNQQVGGSLFQNNQQVGGNLLQDNQQVGRNLFQNKQQVGEGLYQDNQQVGKELFSHKLEDNEQWEDYETCVKRIKRKRNKTI